MLEWYPVLKIIHVGSVCLSLGLFMLRGGWMLADSPRLRQRWVKILPHVVDTTLLASAIGLVLMLRQYPFVQGWLTAKVLALVVYIVLGSIGLKYGRSKPVRMGACIAALAVFGYIVSVALTHDPLGFMTFCRN
ncbi:MAG TPA: SirB2 family protein [Stenotrophobium sp.]|jgi:uncharacterized membrane protein SirB2|nr:SirB2 family protein [Stenotrophobium sp.]